MLLVYRPRLWHITGEQGANRSMGYTEFSSTIHAPVEAVWNALNDIEHTPDWVTGLENAEMTTPPPMRVGSIYTDYNRLGPFLQVTAWHITAFEPLRHQVHESKSAVLPSKITLNVAPVPDGTRLQMIVKYRFMPRLRLISRVFERLVMNRMLKQVLRQNQAGLNRYLSAQTVSVLENPPQHAPN